MIILVNDDASCESALAALNVIRMLRAGHTTYAIRPNVENSPWVKTLWPNENYL